MYSFPPSCTLSLPSLAPAGMGKRHLPPPPENVEKFFLLQMLSQTLVDEVFMHHFEKMSSASGVFAPRLHRGAAPGAAGGLPSFRPFIAPTPSPWKKSCGRPCLPCVTFLSLQASALFYSQTRILLHSNLNLRIYTTVINFNSISCFTFVILCAEQLY